MICKEGSGNMHITVVWSSKLLPNVSDYSMIEPHILNYHLFVGCFEITYIYKGIITRRLDTN